MELNSLEENPLNVVDLDLKISAKGEERTLCSGLNFSLEEGTFTSVIGPNGSGKTTLLKSLAGIKPHPAGHIYFYKKDIQNYSLQERARLVGYHAQAPMLYHDLSVRDLVVLGRAPSKKYFDTWLQEDYEKVEKALEMVGLQDFSNRKCFSLSGGELQRAFLARMLVNHEARVLIMDEPITFLDISKSLDFLDILTNLCSLGYVIICAVHDLKLIRQFSNHVLLLGGKGEWKFGTSNEIITNELIRYFFEIKSNNFGQPHTESLITREPTWA